MSAFQPSANTAAAVGLFTALLAVDDQINKPLGLWLACPAVFARHSNRCGKLQTYGTWIRSDISRKIAQSPGISDSPPPSFGQRISQQLHLHPQLNQFVVPFLFFADQTFARPAFRLRNIAVGISRCLRFWRLTSPLTCALRSPKWAPISRFVSPAAFRRNTSSLSASAFVYPLDMTAPPVVASILQQEVLFFTVRFLGYSPAGRENFIFFRCPLDGVRFRLLGNFNSSFGNATLDEVKIHHNLLQIHQGRLLYKK